jgi:hypothetical protein
MPWIIGIDEAGYGPNLGPFVMTSVACRVPDAHVAADLWHILAAGVRRLHEPADGRLLVEDSKLVYAGARPLRELETNVLATLVPWRPGEPVELPHYLDWACPDARAELAAECWFRGSARLPVVAVAEEYAQTTTRFAEAATAAGVSWGLVRSLVVCSRRFNALLDQWGSKGAVLGMGLTELVRCNHAHAGDPEPMHFFVDKHGGRNNYAAMLQHALPEGMVLAHEEGRARSVYSVRGLGRDLRLTFEPRADSAHLCVALASMFSKYLREILMLEFNRFWQMHLPDLKPTAGYPGDAARYFAAIKPIAERLGIPEVALWRRK